MTTTMRAVVAQKVGEPADVLHLENRPVPEPGPGKVRIRIEAAPVNPNDLHVIRGRYGIAPEFPAVLGQEAVGHVDALGEGVAGPAVGSRVVTLGAMGTWQEYVVHDAARVLGVPDTMSTSTAAQLIANPLTALLLVTSELDLQAGEWLVQTAAGSTVGKLVVQLGRALGFKTINVVRRRAAVQEILALGGDAVICTEDEDLASRLAEIAPDGVTKALDCVGGELGAAVSRALAPGGEMVVYGALATHRQTDEEKLTVPLFARSLIYEMKTVRGFWLHRWFGTNTPDTIITALARVFELVDGGALKIPDGHPMRLDQFAAAVAVAEAPARGGKPLFVFDGSP
jgi:NADPH:quinone reductase-like Zn-dependent oxidoreductase